jgi:hypothetical protein
LSANLNHGLHGVLRWQRKLTNPPRRLQPDSLLLDFASIPLFERSGTRVKQSIYDQFQLQNHNLPLLHL